MSHRSTRTSVNDSPWLDHEDILAAIRGDVLDRSATLRRFAAEAERIGASVLAADLREYALDSEHVPVVNHALADAEAREAAEAEYMVRRGDRSWLLCSRGSDGGMHLRRRYVCEADAFAAMRELIDLCTHRILTGELSVHVTPSGRVELS